MSQARENESNESDIGSWTFVDADRPHFIIDGPGPPDLALLEWDMRQIDALASSYDFRFIMRTRRDRGLREDVAGKLRIARFRKLELALHDLVQFDNDTRRQVVRQLRRAHPVLETEARPFERVTSITLLVGLILIVWLGQQSASQWLGATATTGMIIACACITLALTIAGLYVYEELYEARNLVSLASVVAVGLAILLGAAIYAVVFLKGSDPGTDWELALGTTLCAILTPAWATTIIGFRYRFPVLPSRNNLDMPLVALVMRLIDAGQSVLTLRRVLEAFLNGQLRYVRGGTAADFRAALDNLEAAARVAEIRFERLAPKSHATLRKMYVDAGRSLGTQIRNYKALIADPNHASLDEALTKIAEAIKQLIHGEWRTLAKAPPEKPPQLSWIRFIPRLLLSVALLIFAIFGANIIPESYLPAEFGSIRATLVIVAVFSLITPDVGKARDILLQAYSRKE